jgi:hypothetical protein
MNSARDRIRSLGPDQLNGEWEQIRKQILWAGGLKDLTSAMPGAGYTGHSFNDFNHCDLTTMLDQISDSENQGRVAGIAHRSPPSPLYSLFSASPLLSPLPISSPSLSSPSSPFSRPQESFGEWDPRRVFDRARPR